MNKSNFYLQLKEEEKVLLETLAAIQILIKRYEVTEPVGFSPSSIVQADTEFSVSSNDRSDYRPRFTPDMNITEKVVFTLKILGKATSKEVGQKMHQIDPAYNEDKAIDDARFHLSRLYNQDKLSVSTVGAGKRGHVYMPKQ